MAVIGLSGSPSNSAPRRRTLFSQKGDGQNANKWLSYRLIRPAYNCMEGTSRIEAALVYFTDGTNESEPPPAFIAEKWKPVPPDTVEHMFMQQVCAWKR
jgi:hypothetical protein